MALSGKRLERIDKMIDWIDKTSHANRKDSLEAFAGISGVGYERVKEDAMILGYSVTPDYDLRNVPKSMRNEVRALREKLSPDRVREGSAVFDFINRTVVSDVERLNRTYPVNDEKTLAEQKRIAELGQKIAEEKIRAGMHPVRAYGEMWRDAGNKIHHQINEAIRTVPKENLDDAVKNIWEANFLKAQAQAQYAKGTSDVVSTLKYNASKTMHGKSGETLPIWWKKFMAERYGAEKANAMAPEEMQRELSNALKNLSRSNRPGKERGVPRKFKNTLKAIKEKRQFREFAAAGQHFQAGDRIYSDFKEREKALPEQIRSVSKRSRRFK